MKDHYFNYYLLSYFSFDQTTKFTQILHVFHGKRTPSMFYMIEKNNWHHGFALNQRMDRGLLKKIIKNLLKQQWIKKEENGYTLTHLGQQALTSYFDAHYFPKQIKRVTYTPMRGAFWNRLQLFTQVFSELSYQNKKYIPVIKHPHHQENVRQLFLQFEDNKEEILNYWIEEQSFIFQKLEVKIADVLANLLTGHEEIGETKTQIAQELEMEKMEFYFYLQDAIEVLIHVIKKYQSKLKLSFAILEQIFFETNLGLSASTNQTYHLLKAGHTIEQIAEIRSVKVNTVREHLLEMAFVGAEFPYQQFIPQATYEYLNQRFEENDTYHFRQAMDEKKTIEFMHFRLVELERMRKTNE